MTTEVLVLYHSRHGSVRQLAEKIAIGVEAVGASARIRTVAPLSGNTNDSPAHPVIELAELAEVQAIAVGSPVRFGQMSAEMKHFWEQTSTLWLQGALINKVGGVFTASSSLHGGQEANLLGMMLPLLHHGMLIAGQPYDAPELMNTQTGGTPYGPSHVSGPHLQPRLSKDEQQLCIHFGKRLALLATKLG